MPSQTNKTQQYILNFFFQRKILAWRQNNGLIPIGNNSFKAAMVKGLPDIIAIMPPDGRFLGIEVKTGKDVVSPSQEAFRQHTELMGGTVMIVKDTEDFLKQIKLYQWLMK